MGIVHIVQCSVQIVPFVCIRSHCQRSWKSRGAEHRLLAWTNANIELQTKQHIESTDHDLIIYPTYGEILECGVANKQKHLFLEYFHSTQSEHWLPYMTANYYIFTCHISIQGLFTTRAAYMYITSSLFSYCWNAAQMTVAYTPPNTLFHTPDVT